MAAPFLMEGSMRHDPDAVAKAVMTGMAMKMHRDAFYAPIPSRTDLWPRDPYAVVLYRIQAPLELHSGVGDAVRRVVEGRP
jgi:hypothetical protein